MKDADGYWVGDYWGVISFGVNTDIAKSVPASFADLEKPDYKNMVALNGDPREAGAAFAGVYAAALANGQTPITIDWDYLQVGYGKEFEGKLAWQVQVPSDGVFGNYYCQAISAFAPNPNAAKLWQEFCYSSSSWESVPFRSKATAPITRRSSLPPERPGEGWDSPRRVRCVLELAKLAAHEVGRLLADVDRVVADSLEAAGHDDHEQRPLARRGVALEAGELVDDPPIRAVDQLVELDERLGRGEVPAPERVERDARHLLGPGAHLLEPLDDDLGVGPERPADLRHLGDVHAEVGHSLEVDVHVEDCEDEPEVARDRRLAREQGLDLSLDPMRSLVDLVVEGDHLVRELRVVRSQRVERSTQRPQDEVALLLDGRFQLVELFLQLDSHPNRPVTYPSVRVSEGFVKIFCVSSYSMRIPVRPPPPSTSTPKNAVMSATRAACCMLCVTMMIVY